MSSTDSAHNLLITLVAIGLGIALINTMLLVSHIRDMRERHESWDNGIYNGLEQDLTDMGQKTKKACSCTSYGAPNNVNMPFNDDSSLYKESPSNQSGNGHNNKK
jgi:hypothetical protein